MKRITVFTPTYNRAHCLSELYYSLLKQETDEFIWLVIDDGSTDHTKNLFEEWLQENKIEIKYIQQENRGMLGAHNTAYDNITTELNMCIDSDDYLTDGAIKTILELWDAYGRDTYAGLLGLDIYKNGKVIGSKFPEDLKEAKFSELKKRYNVTGDKKFVYRTKVINEYPRFPTVNGEKFPAAGYLYRLIDQHYKLLTFNIPLCVVEYMPDGNSRNKITQYRKNPNAFALYRLERMRLASDYHERFVNAIHYVSSCLLARRKSFLKESKFKLTILLAIPFGILLYFYIVNTKKKGLIK